MNQKYHRMHVTVDDLTSKRIDELKRYLLSIGVSPTDSTALRFAVHTSVKHLVPDSQS